MFLVVIFFFSFYILKVNIFFCLFLFRINKISFNWEFNSIWLFVQVRFNCLVRAIRIEKNAKLLFGSLSLSLPFAKFKLSAGISLLQQYKHDYFNKSKYQQATNTHHTLRRGENKKQWNNQKKKKCWSCFFFHLICHCTKLTSKE